MHSLPLLLPLCFLAVQPLPEGKQFVNSLGMKFVRIESGTFVMGQGEAPPKSRDEWLQRDWDEYPSREVRISQAFYLGIYEVSNAQYERFDPDHKKFRGLEPTSGKGDDEPVAYVSWQQAVDYCTWLSKKVGKAYRLPTEAEWEYTCRAGTTTLFSTGKVLSPKEANIGKTTDGKAQGVQKVGSYPANPWGLHDMHGNVAEWCHDWYGPYESKAQTDPVGRISGSARVVRGWSNLIASGPESLRYLRSANRSGHVPDDANKYTGFRVALGPLPKTETLPFIVLPHQKDVRQAPVLKFGPDPKQPYFLNYTAEGKNPKLPKDSWGPIFSQHNHYAAVCVCPNGDVLAAWYTCVGEPGRELCQAGSRLRAGSDRWEPASLFFDVPDVNDHAPVLFSDGKRLYHFCTQSFAGWDHASNILRTSDDNGATWSVPRVILHRHDPKALSQPCCCLLLKDGTLALACDGDRHKDERLMTSKDGGQTWQVRAGCMRKTIGKYAIHPSTVQIADGGLLTFLRGPHPMPAVLSHDRGDSYKMIATPLPGISVGQRVAALKLRSGALLVCSHDNKKELVGGGTFAALSLDDGKTWAHVRKVEGVGGYMAVDQAPSGVIYLFGSRMGCVAFNEAWVKEGKAIP